MSDANRDPVEVEWPEPPIAGDDAAMLVAFLERQRATFAWKTSGLDAAGLRATLPPSTMTLGGLLKHLALIEGTKLDELLLGRPVGPPWDVADRHADPDWEWRTAADDSPDELLALWRTAVARSRAVIAAALADGGLDQLGAFTTSSGRSPSLRYILVTLIEEYARHNGHADLLRESVDGLTGEDRPH
jgi:hypothetical protein